MTTIKTYTDLEQSKKLAEILPLESVDMYHFIDDIDKVYKVGFGYRKITADYYSKTKLEYIPCWSLAALLDVLPYPHIEQNYKGKWTCRVELGNTTYLWEASNPIDACVAMVKKLHGLNLL